MSTSTIPLASPLNSTVPGRYPGSMGRQVRLMLADDHEAIREGLRALFAMVGGVEIVDEAGDVDAVLAALRTTTPDAVVLDLSMPRTSGLRAIRQIRELRPATAIVIFTRHADLAFVHEALAAGAAAYVLKQSAFGELRRALASAVAGKRYVDSRLKTPFDETHLALGGRVSLRERDVLRRAATGQSNKDIANALNIAVKTVEVHKANGMRKLDLHDRRDLVRYGAIQGWLLEP